MSSTIAIPAARVKLGELFIAIVPIEDDDDPLVQLNNTTALLSLRVFHLLPEGCGYWKPVHFERAGVRDLDSLLELCTNHEFLKQPIQDVAAQALPPRMRGSDIVWNFEVVPRQQSRGDVIQVVAGHRPIMEEARDRKLLVCHLKWDD